VLFYGYFPVVYARMQSQFEDQIQIFMKHKKNLSG